LQLPLCATNVIQQLAESRFLHGLLGGQIIECDGLSKSVIQGVPGDNVTKTSNFTRKFVIVLHEVRSQSPGPENRYSARSSGKPLDSRISHGQNLSV